MASSAAKVARTGASQVSLLSRFTSTLSPRHPAVLPAQRAEDVGKLTVVLDIDETLVHTDFTGTLERRYKSNGEEHHDLASKPTSDAFKIQLDGHVAHVYKRPHLDWFLEEASKKFELVTFTAGMEHYGSAIMTSLDRESKLVRYRFFRQNCTSIGEMQFTKDLSHLNRPMNRVVLVDNNPLCFLANPHNGIPIRSFYGEKDDDMLQLLMSFLDHLSGTDDVREVLRHRFRLEDRLSARFTPSAHL